MILETTMTIMFYCGVCIIGYRILKYLINKHVNRVYAEN